MRYNRVPEIGECPIRVLFAPRLSGVWTLWRPAVTDTSASDEAFICVSGLIGERVRNYLLTKDVDRPRTLNVKTRQNA
jgi:hypothetical protein